MQKMTIDKTPLLALAGFALLAGTVAATAPTNARRLNLPTGAATEMAATTGGQVFFGHRDGGISLWQLDKGIWSGHRRAHGGRVSSLSVRSDGKLAASGGMDCRVMLWALPELTAADQLPHNFPWQVEALAFSPDGQLLLTASSQELLLWRVDALDAPIQTFTGHLFDIRAVAFSPDGALIASAGADQSVCLWRVESGEMIRRFSMPSDHTETVWDRLLAKVRKPPPVHRAHLGVVHNLAFSADGRQLASAAGWDGGANLSGVGDATLKLWDVETGALRRQWQHPYRVEAVRFLHDEQLLYAGGRNWADGDPSIFICDAEGRTVRQINANNEYIQNVIELPAANLLMFLSESGRCMVYGRTDQRLLGTLVFDGTAWLYVQADGRYDRSEPYSDALKLPTPKGAVTPPTSGRYYQPGLLQALWTSQQTAKQQDKP